MELCRILLTQTSVGPSSFFSCSGKQGKDHHPSSEKKRKKKVDWSVLSEMMFLLSLLLVQVESKPRWDELEGYDWETYKRTFGKSYSAQEETWRRSMFEARLKSAIAHNKGPALYKRGVNALTDLTDDERSRRLGRRPGMPVDPKERHVVGSSVSRTTSTTSLDWRTEGIISTVKDQGSCGSCWAFASTESVESYVALATGDLPVLSPQQLVSCASNPYACGGTGGCEGSIPELAFNYVQLYGQATEASYPYASGFNGTDMSCPASTTSTVEIDGYTKLPMNDKSAVLDALRNVGPLAVNVDASAWHDYDSGIFTGCSSFANAGGNTDLNHVVQLVGYGTDIELRTDVEIQTDYWIIRNSWGVTYGEEGYIRLYKAPGDESCFLDSTPLDGTGCKNGPPTQTVCGECGVLFDTSYPRGARFTSGGGDSTSVVVEK